MSYVNAWLKRCVFYLNWKPFEPLWNLLKMDYDAILQTLLDYFPVITG